MGNVNPLSQYSSPFRVKSQAIQPSARLNNFNYYLKKKGLLYLEIFLLTHYSNPFDSKVKKFR